MNQQLSQDSTGRIDNFRLAQSDMCRGYANGSIGVIASGLMWLIAALVAYQYSPKQAVWALLVGGMFIHPLAVLLCKLIGVKGIHTKGNPLANLGMEGTLFMIMCLPLAYGLSLQHTEWFFQGMLLIIGGRYLTFATLYGHKFYWVLGAVLGGSAYLLFYRKVPSFASLLTGSITEISFGLWMFFSYRRENLRWLPLRAGEPAASTNRTSA